MQFSNKFQSNSRFPELVKLVTAINRHEAMKVGSPVVLENMIKASLIFTVCFYANLLTVLRGAAARTSSRSPFGVQWDTELLHLVLALASEELATDNIVTKQGGYSPHFVPMFEAAVAAGVDVSAVRQFIDLVGDGAGIEEACRAAGFGPALTAYLQYSFECTQSFDDSFATIALRELTLAGNFQVIVDHLPTEERFDLYRTFLTGHIGLDAGDHEGSHEQLMAAALEGVDDVDRSLAVMIRFYHLRFGVYDACLNDQLYRNGPP